MTLFEILFLLAVVPQISRQCIDSRALDCSSKCCTFEDQCALSEKDCDRSFCHEKCPSKCCTGGFCNETDSACRGQTSLIMLLLIIAAATCIAILCILHMKKAHLRRQMQMRRARALANAQANDNANINQNGPVNHPSAIVYQNNASQNLGVEPGMPFREGGMKQAYELVSHSRIEYGEIEDSKRLKPSQNQENEEMEDPKQDNDQEDQHVDFPHTLSIGDIMLKSEYEIDDQELRDNSNGGLSGLENQ